MEGINKVETGSLIAKMPILSVLSKLKIKEKPIVDAVSQKIKIDLIAHINETHIRLNAMRSAFEVETNFDLIEVYIFEIDALERQYSYLIKQAKAMQITAF